MGQICASERTKKLRRFKRQGWLIGILLTFGGYCVFSIWGFSPVQYYVDWYSVHTEKINFFGICGVIEMVAGIVILFLWLFVALALKSMVPCPACGNLLAQKVEICPHCKSWLNWGDLNNPSNHSGQQEESGVHYCKVCGTKAKPGDQFCRTCGRRLL